MEYINDAKEASRLENVKVWKNISGRNKLFPNEQYWSLIDGNSNEAESLLKSGAMYKYQMHGITREQNDLDLYVSKYSIDAYCGDWNTIVKSIGICPNGGIVYLDSITNVNNPEASELANITMQYSGLHTLICANYIAENYHHGGKLDERTLFELLTIPAGWTMINNKYYPPKTHLTQMVTYFFWREF
jgi:hypothetical protein